MNAFNADTTQLRTPLAKTYRQLPDPHRQILQLLSVIYEPISLSALLSCVSKTTIRNSDQKKFTATTLPPLLDDLLSAKLVTQNPGKGIQCHPLIAEIATRDTLHSHSTSLEGWTAIVAH
jgi:hypothetical protein